MKILIPAAFAVLVSAACSGAASNPPAAPAAPAKAPAAQPAAPVAPTPAPAAAAKPAFTGYTNYDTLELTKIVNPMLKAGGLDFQAGEKAFKKIGCPLCHIFGDSGGGIGPNLSGVGGRFGAKEILESILEPSLNVSDLYSNKTVTFNDGTEFTGHRVLDSETEVGFVDAMTIDPATATASWASTPTKIFKRDQIDSIEEAKDSPMPPGLINTLPIDEIADLLAFLMSGGNPSDKFFQPAKPAAALTPSTAPAGAAK